MRIQGTEEHWIENLMWRMRMESIVNRGRPRLLSVAVLLTAAVAVIAFWSAPVSAVDVESSMCLDCHDDVGEAFGMTAHGVYFSQHKTWGDYGCEACHGSGLAHIEDPTTENIINPANADQFSDQLTCLNCHTDSKFDSWNASMHSGGDLNCSSCHTIHVQAGEVTKKAGAELCYECHADVRGASFMPSHHPVAEGKMTCLDCHDVHGGQTSYTMDGTSRELCFSCHQDKEGPFIYEHAPVTEDCMICHTPHGSVANNLLKQAEPALCLSCHPMHFHTISEGIDGPFVDPLAVERNGMSTTDGFKKGMLTKCTQCHSMIHGSDLPSQAGSNGGTALTR